MKTALAIAGSDPTGGAGILADCKTFSAHGLYAMGVITSVTAQNTCKVYSRWDLSPALLEDQLTAVFSDIPPDGVKIGMVPSPEVAVVIADALKKYRPPYVVYDPVMVSSSGTSLMSEGTIGAVQKLLFPLCTVLTPNLPEAEILTGRKAATRKEREETARAIFAMGCKGILLKGGHLPDLAEDLFFDGETFSVFRAPRIFTTSTHGTGCALSSALVSALILGHTPENAVASAKAYVTGAIAAAPGLGQGSGPLHHFFSAIL